LNEINFHQSSGFSIATKGDVSGIGFIIDIQSNLLNHFQFV
jgi:hypothetical protein